MTEQRLQEIEALGRDGYRATWATIDELVAAVRSLRADLAQARAETEDLRPETWCDVCVGTGKPLSDRPCMCGGTGKAQDAVGYLRRELLKAEATIATLRAALTAAQELLELPETCVVCSAILEPREDEAPHCYDCVVTDEHEAERQDRITQLEIALAQAAPAQASGL